MINLTGRLHFLLTGAKLHTAVRAAIRDVTAMLEEREGRTAGERDFQSFAFTTMFGGRKPPGEARYDERFLDAALETVQTTPPAYPREAIQVLGDYAAVLPPASGMASLRRGLKLLLVTLWHKEALLLPTVFNVGPGFEVDRFSSPLITWVRSFQPDGSPSDRRLNYYGHRLLWASTWRSPSDVALSEVAAISRARVLHHNGKSSEPIANAAALPIGLFASKLQEAFPNDVPFTGAELARYSNWTLSHSIADIPFEDFDPDSAPPKPKAPRAPKPKPQRQVNAQPEGRETPHDAILRNFKAIKGKSRDSRDWREGGTPVYPGREHVDVAAVSRIWVDSFRAYMRHRELVKGYRSTADALAALNLLADYLFFYLPWWKEVFPATKVDVPLAPRQFGRYAFVARHTAAPVDEMPATLLELIKLRRPSNESAKVVIHQLDLFFEFVETHFADDEAVAGSSFKSPLNADFDAPRIKRNSKTTKEVIPKHIYGYLLFYCYALEQFGIHLEEMAKAGALPLDNETLRTAQNIQTAAFGFVPRVEYRGNSYPVATVPNVFTWAERELKQPLDEAYRTVFMPHCSALRLLITALETGLRVQSVQWLDKVSWRSLQAGTPTDSYTFPLLVNTDKTKTTSWKTFMVYRVQHMLQRQEAFQAQFVDADAFGPVDYEGLDSSPFDPIRPLFRSTRLAYPLSNNNYDKYWRRIMVSFESFYREATGERHVRMYRMVPRLNDDGTPVVTSDGGTEERPYCPISTLAIHTPHACRATFATNRKGVLELSDAAELLGHADVVVTAHYDKPGEDDLRQRLRESDSAIVSDFVQFQGESVVHVRADRPDSALVKSFNRNREATVKAFKFMPPIALWSTEDSKEEAPGLRMLKEGPMSKVRFRETHICPVGEECPADILEQIGEPRRCGSCPLAMKCVDHLPAIAAKRNQLLERIKYQHKRLKHLQERGEPTAVLDEVWECIELDVNELLGWQLSQEVLERMREDSSEDGNVLLHVEQPEVVKRHLERVTRSSNTAEFVLQRIADSNAYPSLATPQVQLAASQVKRKLLAGQGLDALTFDDDDFSDIRGVSSLLALMMKTERISMKQVAARLSTPTVPAKPLLTAEARDGS
jgi:hypothetical protein